MPGSLTIRHARLVLPDRVVTGDLVVEDGVISEIGPRVERAAGEEIDATGLTVLPGAIDTQVHFREPGATRTEDLASGSRAAAAGGVTAFLDLPDTRPPTTTAEALHDKLALAEQKSVVHYGFYVAVTSDDLGEAHAAERAAALWVGTGPSAGELKLPGREALDAVLARAKPLVAVLGEDETRLRERLLLYTDLHDPAQHPVLRDVETSVRATRLAVELAQKHGQRLHVTNLSSAEEVELLGAMQLGAGRERITTSVALPHLFLAAEEAYARLGTRAVTLPPVRARRHADALWRGLLDGTIDCVASDHSPQLAEEKARPWPEAPAGMPAVEWMLPLLLDRVNAGACSLLDVARWTSSGPARCFRIPRKGRLEIGYDGDLVLVDMSARRTIGESRIWTRCGWSPFEGRLVQGWPVLTAVLGRPVYRDGAIVEGVRGRELAFQRRGEG